ncbi:MAG: hypothetical protein ACRBG0_23475 [Lewinella sp.]|uniref:hypothetical protein n=1 Tax=Lewinella sp. TaxID=2004506 RepID=UPI003D6B1D18
MEDKSKAYDFLGEIVDVFSISHLDSLVATIKVNSDSHPKVGNFIVFQNNDIWEVVGIALVGLEKQGQEVLEKRREHGLWDLQVKPVISEASELTFGVVKFTSKLPPTIIQRDN